MDKRRFKAFEKPAKFKQCSCGGTTKLINRRNFPHGVKSKGTYNRVYVCNQCNKVNPQNKTQMEVKR